MNSISKILSKRDLDKVPEDVLPKVEKCIEDFLTTKVLYENAQRNVGECPLFY